MKYLVVLFLLTSCGIKIQIGSDDKPKPKDLYLTNGYVCTEACLNCTPTVVYNCENALTGQKQDRIYNATNVVVIKGK